jgi:hypothetical protein
MRPIALVLCVLIGCGNGDDGGLESADESPTACERMRDHVIDLRLAGATGVDRAAHREALRSALGADFLDRCEQSMTSRQIDCVVFALDEETAAACTAAAH